MVVTVSMLGPRIELAKPERLRELRLGSVRLGGASDRAAVEAGYPVRTYIAHVSRGDRRRKPPALHDGRLAVLKSLQPPPALAHESHATRASPTQWATCWKWRTLPPLSGW